MAHKKRRTPAQVAATKRMIAANKAKHHHGKKKHGHHKKKRKASHHKKGHHAHHKTVSASTAAHAVKAAVDRAAADMARMARECKAEIKAVKKAAAKVKKAAHAKPHHHKPKHHAKPHHAKRKKRKSGKKKHTGHRKHHEPAMVGGFGRTMAAPRGYKPRKRAAAHRGGFGKTVSARAVIGGAKGKGHKGMQRWVCEAPVRTGCGGGSRGGHVLGDRSRNTAVRFR